MLLLFAFILFYVKGKIIWLSHVGYADENYQGDGLYFELVVAFGLLILDLRHLKKELADV